MLKMALQTHDLLRLLIGLTSMWFGQALVKHCHAWLRKGRIDLCAGQQIYSS
jgi:predicted ATPase